LPFFLAAGFGFLAVFFLALAYADAAAIAEPTGACAERAKSSKL